MVENVDPDACSPIADKLHCRDTKWRLIKGAIMRLQSLVRLALASFALVAMLSASGPAYATELVWRTLNLLNGWQNSAYRPPAIAIDSDGVIHFRGSMYQPISTNPYAFQLPGAYRPTTTLYLTVNTDNASTGRIVFSTDGKVYVQAANYNDAQNFLSLDGVTYTK